MTVNKIVSEYERREKRMRLTIDSEDNKRRNMMVNKVLNEYEKREKKMRLTIDSEGKEKKRKKNKK